MSELIGVVNEEKYIIELKKKDDQIENLKAKIKSLEQDIKRLKDSKK